MRENDGADIATAAERGALGRRAFLGRTAGAIAGGLALAGATGGLLPRVASAACKRVGYGPLAPVPDDTTGLPLLRLPAGFTYRSFGWTGDPLADGAPTPGGHDGMAVVRATHSRLWLVRNHELRGAGTAFGTSAITYDPRARGGTTTLVFDPRAGRFVEAYASIAGTSTNCAGGATWDESWLTCEETLDEYDRTHGWVFEVPAIGAARPEPLRAMGRFVHEAVAVDRQSGVAYLTEDRGSAGFYRFLPRDRSRLAKGGTLQMLAIDGVPGADLRGAVPPGARFRVTWVDIAEPERAHTPGTTDGGGVFGQGAAQGGAVFSRLEGTWYDARRQRIVFVSTSGGAAGEGQIWEYDPRRARLRLLYESSDETVLDNPDNVTVSRDGGILLCEDGDLVGQRLLGLTDDGDVFPFAQNDVVLDGERNGFAGDFRDREWAGATFSPDGRWLFANIQTPGVTFAITGPWKQGALC
ncbi:MAG: alkaline phosphatase PhoX [Thermodesulfobacteriota bacterium]